MQRRRAKPDKLSARIKQRCADAAFSFADHFQGSQPQDVPDDAAAGRQSSAEEREQGLQITGPRVLWWGERGMRSISRCDWLRARAKSLKLAS